MRQAIILLLALAIVSCAASKVQRLNLQDPRLPAEAKRWLADAEDEVAIAWAHMDDSRAALAQIEKYRETQLEQLNELKRESTKVDGEKTAIAFEGYASARVELAELKLEMAQVALELARTRLTQARAETAVRHDVAVYDLQPIVRAVEQLRDDVADAERRLEEQRARVEQWASDAWKAYAQYVSNGGVSNALWSAPK